MLSVPVKAIAAALSLFSLAACSAQSEPSADMSKSDKAFDQKVRDFIMANPEVILESVEAYRVSQLAEAERLAQQGRADLLPKVLSDFNAPTLGPDDAKITIVEFYDYNCGFCKRAADWVFEQLDENSDVKVMFVELPVLGERSPSSLIAARASLAADKQDQFREFHSALMKLPRFDEAIVLDTAKKVGLDVERLKKDMASDEINEQIARNLFEADKAGINGTPGFFIGEQFVAGFAPEPLQAALEAARNS